MHKAWHSRVQNKAQLGGEGDQQGIVPAIKIWSYHQMIYAQTDSDTNFSCPP